LAGFPERWKGISGMSTNEIRLLIITVPVAVVFIVALVLYRDRLLWFKIKTKIGSLIWRNAPPPKPEAPNEPPPKTRYKKVLPDDPKSAPPPSPPPEPTHLPAWPFRRWLKISVPLVLILVLIVVPLWWWHRHSEAWKIVLSDHIAESWVLWKQGAHEPVHVAQSGATLQGLTQLLDGYANALGRDPHRMIEIWVVDHYWQYWTTDTFNDYVRANRRFVDSGGKIHRLFILTQDDLQSPLLTTVLRNQCEKIGADVWRGDATAIGNKAEYQITAKAFEQMPYTETGFRTFDVLQLGDLTYYSSDFSPDYRAVGSSTWFYGQALDLKPLFNKSVAQRVDCSSWRNPQVVQTMQRQ
jgi:hypothetical protein